MKMLDARDTAAHTPYAALVDALRVAAVGVSNGKVSCPPRQVIALAAGAAVLSMIAVAEDLAVHKLVTFVPRNRSRQLPTIQGQVSAWDPSTGAHLISLDGGTVTGRRTAALSMLGVETLLGRRPKVFRIFGTGIQALHHVEAIAQLYPEARITISGRTSATAEAFCAAHAGLSPRLEAHRAGENQTDVVISCTTSPEPVYESPARRGCLIIAVGSFTPVAAEIGAATVRASRLYVDDLDAARQEAGDLIRAGIEWRDVQPLSQRLRSGEVPDGPVLFKTVGHAAWDLAAARVAVAALRAGMSRRD